LSKQQRKPRVLTKEVIGQIHTRLALGEELKDICKDLNIKYDTVKKAKQSGRIILPEKESIQTLATTKSQRSVTDNQQIIGKACSNLDQRILSAKTGKKCTIEFQDQIDLQHAGVLIAIPSLLCQGLLKYEQDFELDSAYYPVSSVFLSLAILSLLRVKTLAGAGSLPSGEMGRMIGLDRIPEVKTLRKRLAQFSDKTDISVWSNQLSRDWMEDNEELSAVLYIDGHVKLYYGKQNPLPKRYVSRMRLALSGTTDYWVNDVLGQPFFVINKVINEGLIQTLKKDLLKIFDEDIPNQPTQQELDSDRYLSRYMLVFDREGYSPDLFYDLWQQRISIATYKKNVTDKWDDAEFKEYTGMLPYGTEQTIGLAERGVLLQNKGSNKKIWVREIRKRKKSGHQTSIITTNFNLSIIMIGLYMFARWGQENFFKYMMQEFGIDTLVSYLKLGIPTTKTLVNPKYRLLESQRKKLTSKLNLIKTKFANLILSSESIEANKMEKYLIKKQELQQEIQGYEKEIEIIKEQKKQTSRKITYDELPEDRKFDDVINQRKQLLDTIKIISYRAETALVNIIKKYMNDHHKDEARLLLKKIYKTDADISVDTQNKTITVTIHPLSYHKDDKILEELSQQLNQTKTVFPDTELTLVYKMGSP